MIKPDLSRGLTIRRLVDTGHETYGQLLDSLERFLCYTLELPWLLNAVGKSCIPAGTYPLRRRYSNKHGCEVFEIANVPDRTDIELHAANFATQLLGCVALGEEVEHFAQVGGDVADSRAAFEAFMSSMAGTDETTVTVTEAATKPAG